VISTLALAIGANTAVFSVLDATLLRPLSLPDEDRVVYVGMRDAKGGDAGYPRAADIRSWQSNLATLERLEARRSVAVLLTDREGGTRVRALDATRGLYQRLGARPIVGRLLHDGDADDGGILIARSLWQTRYVSDPAIVGRAVEIDGARATIVGVIPDLSYDRPGFRNLLYRVLPTRGPAGAAIKAEGLGWLRPGVTIETANAELRSTAVVDAGGGTTFAQARAPANIFWSVDEARNTQLALFAGVCLLLGLATVNVASLLLAATRARRGELALRSALGAGRGRIVRLLLIESLMLCAAGCVGSLLVARYAVTSFAQLTTGPQLATRLDAIRLDAVVLGYAMAIALVTGVAIGLMAAWSSVRGSSAVSLREADARVAGRRGLRGGFVMAESALTVMLLIVAGLIGRAFLNMRFADPGFAADRVVRVHLALPDATYATADRRDTFLAALQRDVSRLSGVVSVGLGYESIPPSDFWMVGRVVADSGVSEEGSGPSTSYVGPEYFALMGIPILEGRGLDAADLRGPAGSEIPILVSRALASHFWPRGSAVGGGLSFFNGSVVRRYRVLGVTGNVRGMDLEAPSCDRCRWQVYAPLPASRRYTELLVRVADGAPIPELGIRRAILDLDRQIPIDDGVITAAGRLRQWSSNTTFRAALLTTFATIGLALAALGIAAVASRTVTERLKEMSIRLALGARPQQVRQLVLRQALVPVALGMTVGVLAALAVTPALGRLLQEVPPSDPLTIASALGLLLAVTLLATWAPARRATRVDPVNALRSE
jgi:putative ABC transport system permease protein